MVLFFLGSNELFAVGTNSSLSKELEDRLIWLFNGAEPLYESSLLGYYVGPRKEMITPWSTNAVEITQNMGIEGIIRIETFTKVEDEHAPFDTMLQSLYNGLDQNIFNIDKKPEPIIYVENIEAYNIQEGLALSNEEIDYLKKVSKEINRPLTDSEVFGFSQVNSEHCRHKIFNGIFVIDGKEKPNSLFQMIKKTSQLNPNELVSAYKDNVAFNRGPRIEQFAPASHNKPDFFSLKPIESVISLKAETHNFPTTVEPFNGAATGAGGEIRDRLAGGTASLPLAGTAVYMTAYPRLNGGRSWEKKVPARSWLYQTPQQILIKASNGASDFGNKFGQPLICGSLLTFEYFNNADKFAYDKVIMLAGGVGYGKFADALKKEPKPSDRVVILGGDNYRIGMGGGAVSSVDTGVYSSGIELNAVQRANPEMQKRAANVIRALSETEENPIVSIHDHGAGGHLNSLSELVENTGGCIQLDALPVGDSTLSAKEIIGNESQERMGMVLKKKDIDLVKEIADRERSPMYDVGEVTGDMKFVFEDVNGNKPMDLKLEHMFGKSPKTILEDVSIHNNYEKIIYEQDSLSKDLEELLQLEAVACKDWLTNKVDRSITGKVAKQQTVGEIQLPLNNLGAVALDYRGEKGVATSVGHAPAIALIDSKAGSIMAIAESLTNLVWAPCADGLKSVSLSANWMWPCRNVGEDARLYDAVEACSDFACALGINIPTGKDSMSMTQKYGEEKVLSPGTVIISAGAEISDIRKIVSPAIKLDFESELLYIDLSSDSLKLGGSSFAQIHNAVGESAPNVLDFNYFKEGFNALQELVNNELILSGHDVSSGGLITALLEMNFPNTKGGLEVFLDGLDEKDIIKCMFAENSAVLIQINNKGAVSSILEKYGIKAISIANLSEERLVTINHSSKKYEFDIESLRDIWFKTSYLLDKLQSGNDLAKMRFDEYKKQPLVYEFPQKFNGTLANYGLKELQHRNVKAAIIREKGSNGDREMAYALYLAGFNVKDVHTTDLISGRETLEDIQFIVFVGGFSNSDVLGSAKGWAGALLYNEKAKKSLDRFYASDNTLSLGVCNGCQLMVELNLLYPKQNKRVKMLHNDSHKFESSFVGMKIESNNSILFSSLSDSQLGIWVAHGEGKFSFPETKDQYNIVGTYSYDQYPANPNGSDYAAAAIASHDGRHVAMMPHLERAIFPWQWPYYTRSVNEECTPWLEAFVNARKWIENNK